MTTFYLDFEGGNDANDGTTFANRWKTFNSGATAARTAPGDTIRIMASRGANSVGNATWTDNSATVTLASALSQTIWNGDEAWTGASANITASTSTALRKIGATCALITPAAAFGTGIAAYKTIGSLDLSGYQQVGFWVLANSGNSFWELRLCTDTLGVTAVHTIPITTSSGSQWTYILWDNAAALNSAIQSVAVYAASDPGTSNFRIQNIVAFKDKASADCITGLSLLGKNTAEEPCWYPIDTIDGTSIVLGGPYYTGLGSSDTSRMTYRRSGSPSTEAVPTYALQTINVTGQTTANRTVQEGGSGDSWITYSGGWNRTDMSTQTGETWISGSHYQSTGITLGPGKINLEKVGFAHLTDTGLTGMTTASGPNNVNIPGAAGCVNAATTLDNRWYGWVQRINIEVAACNGYHSFAECASGKMFITGNKWVNAYNNSIYAGPGGGPLTYTVNEMNGSKGVHLMLSNSPNGAYPGGRFTIRNCDFLNTGGSYIVDTNDTGGQIHLHNCSFDKSVVDLSGQDWRDYQAICHKYNKTEDDHRLYGYYREASSETSVRHTASGMAWKIQPTNVANVNFFQPAELPLATFAFNAGALVTVKCWCRRTNTGITAGIKVIGGWVDGVASDVSAEMTAIADTWEELTITFTPTEKGVLELIGYAHGGTTYTAYFDDFSVTQA